MPRYRRYLDIDVLSAARKRMLDIYRIHDHVVVGFSGGKDSLVCLQLAKEAATALGRLPVDVMFYDEELIPKSVLDCVDYYRQQDWCKLRWCCFPLESNKFILGRSFQYIQWDPNRPHLRPPPPWAEFIEPHENPHGTLSQYEVSAVVADRWFPGRVSNVIGLRASESLLRLRSCLGSRGYAWLVTPHNNGRLSTSRPIYDWAEDDVLKYIYEHDLTYAALYNSQHLQGRALRVSTPLHSEAAKKFHTWREIDPVFYQQIVDLFPEMTVQERYWREFDQAGMHRKYGQSWDGIAKYIDDTFTDPVQRVLAYRRLQTIKDQARLRPEQFGLDAVLRYFLGGTLKRAMMGNLTTGGKDGKEGRTLLKHAKKAKSLSANWPIEITVQDELDAHDDESVEADI